ncbi:MAG: hypothetical protein Q7S74_04185 [Nanoarchaeota archaeon]|nr:hypothetical protein [Nanoarchaeota archaeon]
MNIQNRQENNIKRNSRAYKILGLLLIPLLSLIVIIPNVMAHCPLCTAATIMGVGVTRSLGWDDSIVGVFVGAMIVSSALWVNNIFKKRNIGGNPFLRIGSITVATFVLTILSFYYAGIFGPANTYRIFGMEKIIFGSISGAIVSFAIFFASNEIKRRNEGKVLFNYQTMTLTFGVLILNALIFWMVFK